MTLQRAFCPSPWFHMRITNNGDMKYCRWANEDIPQITCNIRERDPMEFFQQDMAPVRQQFLQGEMPAACIECHNMEKYGKVSGREKQLLKIGARTDQFAKSLKSSPFYNVFEQTLQHQGKFNLMPQDWQVDLGNFCNSACVFCVPDNSSRLATELKKLDVIDKTPPRSWCDDPQSLQRFIETIKATPHIRYMHFIGGETLITPAFRTILEVLIGQNMHQDTTIGFTTNLTIWPQDIVDLISQFKEVHLGLSIETLTSLNDYVRWPGRIEQTRILLDRWVELGQNLGWHVTMRITPTVLTVHEVWTVYEYAVQHGINVESCNFLHRPSFMRPTVLPKYLRQTISDSLENWINQQSQSDQRILNVRSHEWQVVAALQDALSYVDYLRNGPDESDKLPDLMQYLGKLDRNRGITVLDYLPQYANLFRTAGY